MNSGPNHHNSTIDSWLKSFSWLEINNNFAFCKFCKIHNLSNPYATGTSTLKKNNFEVHENSHDHKNAVNKQTTQTKLVKQNVAIPVLPKTRIPENIFPLFREAFFLAHEDIAIYKSDELFTLFESVGVNLTKSYRNEHGISEIIECISNDIEFKLIQELSELGSFGIQLDESTDIGDKKLLCIFVSFISKGKMRNEFLKILELTKSDAKSIFESVKGYFSGNNLYTKISSLCTDGAPVMCSTLNGLAGLLKRDLPGLVSVHCFAHKINLVSKDILEQFTELKLLNSTIYSLCKLFKKSTAKIQILEEYELQELKTVKKLIRPINIRWFSMYRAICRVIELFPSIISALSDIKNENVIAEGLYVHLKSFKFISLIHFMADLLSILNNLNLAFQKDNLKIARANMFIDTTKRRIRDEMMKASAIKENLNMKFLISKSTISNDKHLYRGILILIHPPN